MIKDVQYPIHVLHGIRPLTRGFARMENLRIFGADTETCMGEPITVQIDGPDDSFFVYTDRDRVFPDFFAWIFPRLRMKGVNICYFHYLNFDLRVLFRAYHLQIYEQFGDAKFIIPWPNGDVEVRMLFGKVNKATLKCQGRCLQIYDSKAFTQASLARSLKMFLIPEAKMKSPYGLGWLDFGKLPHADPRRIEFEEYSRVDALAERKLGQRIAEIHQLYDASVAISLPSFSAKILRRHFLKPKDTIPFPPIEIAKASEFAFHGGRNGFYLHRPQVIEDLYELDINSAYPYAMACLPPLTEGQYHKVTTFDPTRNGVYCISGEAFQFKYPLVYDHSFKPIKLGPFEKLWHTGYEVAEMLAGYHVRIRELWGYVWEPAAGAENPFKKFVEHFYEKRQQSGKGDPYNHFYKTALNALYGKLLSTTERKSLEEEALRATLSEMGCQLPPGTRIDERYDPVLKRYVGVRRAWTAGSLYNPFWGGQVTGHTRAYLSRLELQYNAVHSATDSVKAPLTTENIQGLGGLKTECFGRCFLFRNKLYLHFSKTSEFCGHGTPEKPYYEYPKEEFYEDERGNIKYRPHPRAGRPLMDEDGQHLCKYALHAYKGPLWMLFDHRWDLIHSGKMRYQYIHVIGLREGMRRKKPVCNFVIVTEDLNLFASSTEQEHLLTFILKRGGFSLTKEARGFRGELKRWDFKNSGIRGLVNLDKGLSVDHMRELAQESLYCREGMTAESFIDLVDRAVRGEKIYGDNPTYWETEVDMEKMYGGN